MSSQPIEEKLSKRKAASVLQLLFKTARLGNDLALERVNFQKKDTPPLRPSHTSLFPHIDFLGTRITDIASRLGISKQAVSQLVDDLEQRGTLERTPDPLDGRAKLVTYSKRGRLEILEGLTLLNQIEKELEQALGRRKMHVFRKTLSEILAHFESS